jgi:hypothetical protein
MALLLTGVLGGSGPSPAGAASTRTSQTADRDSVQSGDQSAPETASGENESGNEPAGEAKPGHEDPQGEQVDHQCPPDCAPGELP